MALHSLRPWKLVLRAFYQNATSKQDTQRRQRHLRAFSSSAKGSGDSEAVAGQSVVSERRGAVVTVALNRPEARNAVNQETAWRLLQELEAFDRDPDLNVAVLHGNGGNFCAGYDLKELANHTDSLKLEQDVTKGPGPLEILRYSCLPCAPPAALHNQEMLPLPSSSRRALGRGEFIIRLPHLSPRSLTSCPRPDFTKEILSPLHRE